MKRFSCSEVVPGCDATFEAAPELADEVVAKMEDVSSDEGAPPAPAG